MRRGPSLSSKIHDLSVLVVHNSGPRMGPVLFPNGKNYGACNYIGSLRGRDFFYHHKYLKIIVFNLILAHLLHLVLAYIIIHFILLILGRKSYSTHA